MCTLQNICTLLTLADTNGYFSTANTNIHDPARFIAVDQGEDFLHQTIFHNLPGLHGNS